MAQTVPSPRPTLAPTAQPAATSTSRPKSHSSSAKANPATGHITGTVIDLTSGAPVAGIPVNIGGVLVSTDVNGNYDRWVPAGSYSVMLALEPSQGVMAQKAQLVEVGAGDRVVLHLNFRGPAGNTLAAASATPGVPPTEMTPARLPVTAAPADDHGWLWLPFGMALLLGGALLLARPARVRAVQAAADPFELLARLLASPTPRRSADDELLARLLETRD
jgi:hypothetical protein